jgi:hypothetical protein
MKIIKYQLMTEVNHGTEDEPNIVQTLNNCELNCSDDTFEAAYALALKEAYNGDVTVEDAPDPETPDTPTGDDSIWEELDKAYQEGVDSV